MKDFVYNKGGTAIIRPLHFHDVKGFLLRIIRIMRGIYKEEAMSKNLEKTYNPKEIEAKLYERWCENKYFHAEVDSCLLYTSTMPRSIPSVKLMKQSAIKPVTVVTELPKTEEKVLEMAWALSLIHI